MKIQSHLPFSLAGVIPLSTLMLCGCSGDANLAGEKVRHAEVHPVAYYGMTLDQTASPEQVAYAALRAIRDDFLAKTPAEREAAVDRQFDLSAADIIASRNRTALSRDEFVHYVVTEWTPTVSHYVHDFETEPDKALARFVNRTITRSVGDAPSECELALEVSDPGSDPNARAVMLVWLAKDNGYWRILHFGFEPKRSLAVRDTAAPSRDPAP